MPPIAMRNCLRIGPEAAYQILPLLRPAVPSGDGDRVPVGMPPGDTQSFAARSMDHTRDLRLGHRMSKTVFLLLACCIQEGRGSRHVSFGKVFTPHSRCYDFLGYKLCWTMTINKWGISRGSNYSDRPGRPTG